MPAHAPGNSDQRIGVDFGGTKIEGIALGAGNTEIARKRIATPRGDYAASLKAVRDLVGSLESATGVTGTVGVGIPGTPAAQTGLVKNANSTWLNGRPFGRDLEAALNRPVRLANDADCFALSEAIDGAGAGCHTVFGVILGTGVGGGIVIDKQLLIGANAIAGEWGHNPLPEPADNERPGPACYCGRSGCIETWLSGPGFEADFAALSGTHAKASDIAAADTKNVPAQEAFRRYADRLARALAGIINILDPDVIVLGGGMSNIETLYRAVPSLWGAHVFSDTVITRLVRNRHGDSGGVRGAAWLWPDPAGENP